MSAYPSFHQASMLYDLFVLDIIGSGLYFPVKESKLSQISPETCYKILLVVFVYYTSVLQRADNELLPCLW